MISCTIIAIAIIIIIIILLQQRYDRFEIFIESLNKAKQSGDIQDINDHDLQLMRDDILAVSTPQNEGFTLFHPIDERYMQQYVYNYPYRYLSGMAWPPGAYSRFYYEYPGFDTNGQGFWMRPGIYYKTVPRGMWVRNNDTYYFINNGTREDRKNDYY